MKRLGLLLLATAAVACGDNSDECGPGTTATDGICMPDGSGAICGDGTKLDTTTGGCVVDPMSCGGGTVLVNGTCQDPTAGLTVDLEEAAEPNGLDAGSHSAGTIALKAVGDPNGFVVHGCVKPVSDTADLDAYTLSVSAPTLVDITADGVQGLAAGFVSLANPNDTALASWQRFGLNLATDMSHREIFFPKAGTYVFVMSDTRSLLGLVDGATDTLEPAGNPDGTSCYYVTLKQEAIPAPTAKTTLDDITGTTSDKVQFFSVPLPNGFIRVSETIDSTHAGPAFEVSLSDQFRVTDDGTGVQTFAGVKDTDTSVIAVDFAYNYGITPADFDLSFVFATTAQALPTANTTVNSTTISTAATFDAANYYYFDVATAGETFGMKLNFTKGMTGAIRDSDNFEFGQFGEFATPTFTTYTGLWRAPAAGRYYLIVIDPTDAAGTAFTLTSTLTAVTPTAIAVGTPLTAQPVNAFKSVPYTLDLTGNDVWDTFNATGTTTGDVAVTLYDPATAFGRLDGLTMSDASVTLPSATPVIAGSGCPATVPGCSFDFLNTGGAQGFIVKSFAQTNLLVKVNPAAPTGTPTFGLDFAARTFTDLMAIVAPHTTVNNGETVTSGAVHRYLFTTDPGNLVTITVHPTVATNNPVAHTDTPNESILVDGNGAAAGADEVISYTQDASGYTAIEVSNAVAAAMTYNLTVNVTPPYYTKHASATAFADACVGGTTITLTPNDDDGVSPVQTTPTGFTFFGATHASYLIGSNGYLTFDLTDDGATYPDPIPDGTGLANIMPFWEDLEQVVVCKKVTGTKTTIQWTGAEFGFFGPGAPAQFQAILDTADSSIEYVYGPGNVSDGTTAGAIGGVQNPAGDQATETGDGTVAAFGAPNTSVKLTHP